MWSLGEFTFAANHLNLSFEFFLFKLPGRLTIRVVRNELDSLDR